jgi:spermidine synthase
LLLAAGLALLAGRRRAPAAATLGLAAAGALLGALPSNLADPSRGLLTVRESPYAEIRVVDHEDARMLFIDGGLHTLVERPLMRTRYHYVVVMEIPKLLFDEPGSALLVGLGGGSLARSYRQSGWEVDAVEIDREIANVAREYFGLEERDARIHLTDAREYLSRPGTAYDLILLDAFGSSSIPFHLVTREHFALVKSRLAKDGVLAVNVEAHGWDDEIVEALCATLKEQFREVWALPIAEPPDQLGNLILLAADRELDFADGLLGHPQDFLDDEYLHWRVIEQNHAWDNRFRPKQGAAPVLTDDRNPVDLWSEAINFEARKALHRDSGWKDLAY